MESFLKGLKTRGYPLILIRQPLVLQVGLFWNKKWYPDYQ